MSLTKVSFSMVSGAPVNVMDLGFSPTNTDAQNGAAVATIVAAAFSGTPIHFPYGTYLTNTPLLLAPTTHIPVARITADPGTRIKLTASADYVMSIDGSGITTPGRGWVPFAYVENLTLDGNGFAVDGLLLKAVLNATFNDINTTNATRAGLHLAWAQTCLFNNFSCSGLAEPFTTTPVNGILVDGAASSANTFVNVALEKVSGSGLLAKYLFNTVFINGTSEGNDIGLEFGETVGTGSVVLQNTVIGMDLEENATSDIIVRSTATGNDFIGLKAGFNSPRIQVLGSKGNTFYGGSVSGVYFDAASQSNVLSGVKLVGTGATSPIITDVGTFNSWQDVLDQTNNIIIGDKLVTRRANFAVAGGATVTINCAVTSYAVVTTTGATVTIAAPINGYDAQELDMTIHNTSGGAITVTWDAAFKITGFATPATGFYRSLRFRYDSNYGFWYVITMTATDYPN